MIETMSLDLPVVIITSGTDWARPSYRPASSGARSKSR